MPVASAVGDRFAEEAIQSAANAWTDDELSVRDRSLIVIAALIAQGDLEAQLRMHTRWALDHVAERLSAAAFTLVLLEVRLRLHTLQPLKQDLISSNPALPPVFRRRTSLRLPFRHT